MISSAHLRQMLENEEGTSPIGIRTLAEGLAARIDEGLPRQYNLVWIGAYGYQLRHALHLLVHDGEVLKNVHRLYLVGRNPDELEGLRTSLINARTPDDLSERLIPVTAVWHRDKQTPSLEDAV